MPGDRRKLKLSAAFDRAFLDRSEELMELVTSGNDHSSIAVSTAGRRNTIAYRYEQAHALGTWGDNRQNPWRMDGLEDRIKDFITICVAKSSSVRDGTCKMTAKSVQTLKNDCVGLMVTHCGGISNCLKTRPEWSEALKRHYTFLVEEYELETDVRIRRYFGPSEARLIEEDLLQHQGGCIDNKLQHCVLIDIFLYTACRPGSVLSTHYYPNWYTKYKHVKVLRTPIKGRFKVILQIIAFKGGHGVNAVWQEYNFTPVDNPQYLTLDIGIKAVALGLRRGAFRDYVTLDQLLHGDEEHLLWNPSHLDLPFFCISGPSGASMDYDKPMTAEFLRLHMDRCCQRVGLGGRELNNTTYNFRRWTITEVVRQGNSELAKSLVRHSHGANTAVEVYSFQVITTDLVQVALSGRDDMDSGKGLDIRNAAAVFRLPGTAEIPSLSVEQALERSSALRQVCAIRASLALAMADDVELDWESIKSVLPSNDLELVEKVEATSDSDSIEAIYGVLFKRYTRRYRELLARVRALHCQMVRLDASGEDVPHEVVAARLEVLEEPSHLPEALQSMMTNKMLRKLVEEPSDDEDECTLSLEDDETPRQDPNHSLLEIHTERMSTMRLDERRLCLLKALTSYSLVDRGPQRCALCEDMVPLSEWNDLKVFPCGYKVDSHRSSHFMPSGAKKMLGPPVLSTRAGSGPCPLCEADKSIPLKFQKKHYISKYKLNIHVRTHYYIPPRQTQGQTQLEKGANVDRMIRRANILRQPPLILYKDQLLDISPTAGLNMHSICKDLPLGFVWNY